MKGENGDRFLIEPSSTTSGYVLDCRGVHCKYAQLDMRYVLSSTVPPCTQCRVKTRPGCRSSRLTSAILYNLRLFLCPQISLSAACTDTKPNRCFTKLKHDATGPHAEKSWQRLLRKCSHFNHSTFFCRGRQIPKPLASRNRA